MIVFIISRMGSMILVVCKGDMVRDMIGMLSMVNVLLKLFLDRLIKNRVGIVVV